MPKVIVVFVDNAKNSPSASDVATIENTIDVATIGALCPSPLLTIMLFIGSYTSTFSSVLGAAIRANPSIISISWGLNERDFAKYDSITSVNSLLASAVAAGINVTAATGDWGSSDGVAGINVDFPSSSPYVVACGGTTLVCPSDSYSSAKETAWALGGGGISKFCERPTWQPAALGSMRSTPDIAMNADPDTGVSYIVGGSPMIIGGTSVVSPAFAAFLACIRPSQFVGSLLYTAPTKCFNDILTGSNGASDFYTAAAGHDKCTGLGSINGVALAPFLITPVFVKVSSITMPTKLSLAVGSSSTVATTIIPAAASNKNLVWSSRTASVATVDPTTGIITAVGPGTSVITASANNGSGPIAYITVYVVQLVMGLSLASTTIARRSSTQLALTVSPANASNKNIEWSSSSATISVNKNGIISAKGASGSSAVITVHATDGSNKSASCTVKIQ